MIESIIFWIERCIYRMKILYYRNSLKQHEIAMNRINRDLDKTKRRYKEFIFYYRQKEKKYKKFLNNLD